jgi:hypothetical protein
MRFLADSPSIPDDLLVARDQGGVVFFAVLGFLVRVQTSQTSLDWRGALSIFWA